MRVHYMSDLHLEFSNQDVALPSGEVLILAGDMTIAYCLDPANQEDNARKARESTARFFDQARRNFRDVILLSGNHEPYGYDIDGAHDRIRATLAGDNVHYLENEAIEINGARFLGCTLWTDMDGRNPSALNQVGRALNDFYLVATKGRRFTTSDAADRHDASLAWLDAELNQQPDRPVIVVTHHAPSYQGLHGAHVASALNPGLASNLDGFISAHPNIMTWVFGHTHVRKTFAIGETVVRSNAAGYPGRERKGWNPDTWFEVT